MDQSVSGRFAAAAPGLSARGRDEAAVVAAGLDAAFYLHRYGDVRAAGIDAAAHYCDAGWREGRDPADWFDTNYYLRANPDIAAAGVNPFWHFLVQGRREGRLPQPPGHRWQRELRALLPRSQQAPWRAAPLDAPVLDAAALRARVAAACAGARGLAVALSHDRYTDVPGGTQLLIADEQRKFNGDGAAYLHLSPAETRLGLAPADGPPLWLTAILDGAELGIAPATDIAAALSTLPGPACRLLVVHNLHGHRPEVVVQLTAALRPRHAFFWVHDYGAGCGSPRLLRNDIAFCAAPPPDSMACRICTHGEDRAEHLARMRALFEAVPFRVLAPSAVALELWRRSAALPAASEHVHPHAELIPGDAVAAPAAAGAVRVAFVGHPAFHKGWGLFRELVLAARDLDAYQFFQFASPAELRPHDGVTAIAAAASPARPFGMAQALAEQRIDLVVAASPWPETFGYVPHEAIAAGAEVVTIAASGNIAAMLRAAGRGLVLPDEAALLACFLGLDAARHALARRAAAAPPPTLRHAGSTATIALDPYGAPPPMTGDPDLHVLADGARIDGVRDGDTYRFDLPASGTPRLRSRHVLPVWETACGADERRLGVAVTHMALDGVAVPPDDARHGTGWHAPEPGWRWTDGDATLHAGAARTLDVVIRPLARYWQSPLLAP